MPIAATQKKQKAKVTEDLLVSAALIGASLAQDLEEVTAKSRAHAGACLATSPSPWEIRRQLDAWAKSIVDSARFHVARYVEFGRNHQIPDDIGTWVRQQMEARIAAHLCIPDLSDSEKRPQPNKLSHFIFCTAGADDDDRLPEWVVAGSLGQHLARVGTYGMLSREESRHWRDILEGLVIDELRDHMLRIEEEVAAELAAKVGRDNQTHPAKPTAAYVFKKESSLWRITFGGTAVSLKDAVGLGYIHKLVAIRPRSIPAIELMSLGGEPKREFVIDPHPYVSKVLLEARERECRDSVEDGKKIDPTYRVVEHGPKSKLGLDRLSDDEALKKYAKPIAELKKRLETAFHLAQETGNASAWTSAVREAEMFEDATGEKIFEETATESALAVPQRSLKRPRFSTEDEKARKSVRAAIRESLDKIDAQHEPLAAYLKQHLKYGYAPSFTDASTDWVLS